MTGKNFDRIASGLRHAIADARGEPGHVERVTRVPPLDVAAVRRATGLTQREFARTFQFSYDTYIKWEQGARMPSGPTRLLLHVIRDNPKAVLRIAQKISRPASHVRDRLT